MKNDIFLSAFAKQTRFTLLTV